MGRKKESGAEVILNLVARMPWWAGVLLAFVSWVIFHKIAGTQPDPATLKPGQAGPFVQRALLAALATWLQYIIPFLCLLGALLSFLRQRKRKGLLDAVTKSPAAETVSAMDWREFEMLVGEAFRLEGYAVKETGAASADGGVDLELRKGTELHLVQCKHWKAFKVDVKTVREFYGVMAARGAAGGFVVTSGTFTADAKAFADGRNVRLVDGAILLRMITRARGALAIAKARSPVAPKEALGGQAAVDEVPACPRCGGAMVWRTAKQGANAGSMFWGCAKFPACRGTR